MMAFFKRYLFPLLVAILSASPGTAQPAKFSQAIYLFQLPDGDSSQTTFNRPRGISVDLSGMLYVCDTENHRILTFDGNGNALKCIGGFGWEKDMFYTPLDIYASSALDVFVADYNNNRIQRYDKDLNYISTLASDESLDATLQFGYPKSVVNSIHGDLLVLDGENNRLLKLNSFGEPEISFGDYGEGRGRLLNPIQLAISPDDKIFVSDAAQNKIIVFDYFGNYLSEIGALSLNDPQGICYCGMQVIAVADRGNARVALFDANGNPVFAWSKISERLGAFRNPVDVAAFDNRFYVLDDDTIFVFELH
ncbi:MAG: NHL repeat-containing protein [Candidatus Zhuqueibacterota bacterium]